MFNSNHDNNKKRDATPRCSTSTLVRFTPPSGIVKRRSERGRAGGVRRSRKCRQYIYLYIYIDMGDKERSNSGAFVATVRGATCICDIHETRLYLALASPSRFRRGPTLDEVTSEGIIGRPRRTPSIRIPRRTAVWYHFGAEDRSSRQRRRLNFSRFRTSSAMTKSVTSEASTDRTGHRRVSSSTSCCSSSISGSSVGVVTSSSLPSFSSSSSSSSSLPRMRGATRRLLILFVALLVLPDFVHMRRWMTPCGGSASVETGGVPDSASTGTQSELRRSYHRLSEKSSGLKRKVRDLKQLYVST